MLQTEDMPIPTFVHVWEVSSIQITMTDHDVQVNPQNSHGMAWDRLRSPVVKGRR